MIDVRYDSFYFETTYGYIIFIEGCFEDNLRIIFKHSFEETVKS